MYMTVYLKKAAARKKTRGRENAVVAPRPLARRNKQMRII